MIKYYQSIFVLLLLSPIHGSLEKSKKFTKLFFPETVNTPNREKLRKLILSDEKEKDKKANKLISTFTLEDFSDAQDARNLLRNIAYYLPDSSQDSATAALSQKIITLKKDFITYQMISILALTNHTSEAARLKPHVKYKESLI